MDQPDLFFAALIRKQETKLLRMDAILTRSQTLENTNRSARVAPRQRRAHMVGVAGSGMRALADVLAGWGWQAIAHRYATTRQNPTR
jgi:hypothetical protein